MDFEAEFSSKNIQELLKTIADITYKAMSADRAIPTAKTEGPKM